MALWLVRAGSDGEHEPRFFEEGRIYLTWDSMTSDLSGVKDWDALKAQVRRAQPADGDGRVRNHTGQIWAFVMEMKPGDLVVTPRRGRSSIAVGEIAGLYAFDPAGAPMYQHCRAVRWKNLDVPRSAFGTDLLASFGAIMTICQVKRNEAEQRVRAMEGRGWAAESLATAVAPSAPGDVTAEVGQQTDIERLARDQIVKVIERRFKGHGMARLVEAILQAKGFQTKASPPGPDGGVDILAAPEPFGFGEPRICVQVKSTAAPVDRPTVDQLRGVMEHVRASQGLFVSWSGFRRSLDGQENSLFFKIRLWDQDDLVDELLREYGKLPEDVRAELPLKRVWALALDQEPEE